MNKTKILRVAAVLGAVAILGAAAMSVDSTYAARGGKKGGGQTTSTAKLTVTPNPLPAYTQPTVSGSGFAAGETVYLSTPGELRYTTVTANSAGAFSVVYSQTVFSVPGTYTMDARNAVAAVRASASFVVN